MLVLAAAGCSSGGSSPEAAVYLDAGPAEAAAVDPVHVSISGLPAAALVTEQFWPRMLAFLNHLPAHVT